MELTNCTECGGQGHNPDYTVCETCMGTGVTPVRGLMPGIFKRLVDMNDKLNDIKEKVDEIKTVVDAL